MNKTTRISFVAVLAVAIVSSCGSKKERPSPLVADSTTINDQKVLIKFGSPAVNDRVIWGELVPFDEMWRTGANEATRLFTTETIKLNGESVDSGTYAVFTLPGEKEWRVILNTNHEQWGTYNYDSTLDVLDIKLRPRITKDFSERMKFSFEQDSLKFHWENLKFSLGIE